MPTPVGHVRTLPNRSANVMRIEDSSTLLHASGGDADTLRHDDQPSGPALDTVTERAVERDILYTSAKACMSYLQHRPSGYPIGTMPAP